MTELPPIIGYAIDPGHEAPAEYDVLCEGCGRSLISIAGTVCPDCRKPFDPSTIPLARIPWLYRQRSGKWNTYFRTVWRICFTPFAFKTELLRPVRISLRDARQFRLLTVWIAAISALVAEVCTSLAIIINVPFKLGLIVVFIIIQPPLLIVYRSFFGFISDLPTFIWKGAPDRPNELQPIHLYACAPLVATPVVALSGIATTLIAVYFEKLETLLYLQIAFTCLVAAIVIIYWYLIPLFFARSVLSTNRLILLALYLPIHGLMGLFIFYAIGGLMVAGIFAGVRLLLD